MTRRHPHCGLFSCKGDRECVFPRECIGPKVEAKLVPLDLPPELAKVVDRDPYSKLADFIRDPATSTADRIGAASKLRTAPYGASHLADVDAAQAARLKADIASFGETAWRVEGESCDWTIPTKRHWFKRLPVIRHIGALVLSWQVHTYAGEWSSIGIGVGGPSAYDLWCVEGAFHGYW